MRTARVFPRRTNATPIDPLAFVGSPPLLFPPPVDAVHISVSFTWDIPAAERLAKEWEAVAPVTLGGPAMGTRGENFTPGMYLRDGYVITSRGCPMRCEHCQAWRRDGVRVRELPVCDGWNVLDDNLLRCSRAHIEAVFAMLHRQDGRAEFTGGLEAMALKDWHIDLLRHLRPKQMFFAYDEPADLEPLVDAGRRLLAAGWTRASHTLRAYVLVGGEGDTLAAAESRCRATWHAGFVPMAMLFINNDGGPIREDQDQWEKFRSTWTRPARIAAIMKGG